MKKTARDLMWENGGPGVWAPDYRAQYDLKNDEWKFDSIPEIINGKTKILKEKSILPGSYEGDPQILWALLLASAGFLFIILLVV